MTTPTKVVGGQGQSLSWGPAGINSSGDWTSAWTTTEHKATKPQNAEMVRQIALGKAPQMEFYNFISRCYEYLQQDSDVHPGRTWVIEAPVLQAFNSISALKHADGLVAMQCIRTYDIEEKKASPTKVPEKAFQAKAHVWITNIDRSAVQQYAVLYRERGGNSRNQMVLRVAFEIGRKSNSSQNKVTYMPEHRPPSTPNDTAGTTGRRALLKKIFW